MKSEFKLLIIRFFFLTSMISGLLACTGRNKPLEEVPTRGNIRISVDESYKLLIDAEIYVFTTFYPYATITPDYKPEWDVISDFMNDSVQVVITSYKLNEDQIEYLYLKQYIPKTVTFAYDAVALILHKENPDSLLTYQNIQDIFTGKITRWTEINPQSPLDKIAVIFDHSKSGNVRYFKEKFDIAGNLPDNFYAVNSNEEVIDYISRSKNGMGIISVNWISDPDDSISMSFISKINVAAISRPYMDESTYYRPYQGSIYNKTYPFTREVYLISRETFTGLGSGFMAWMTNEKGQKIVLKSGLVPATMPVRILQFAKQ